MAKWSASLVLVSIAALALAGCQQAQPASVVTALPAPNFSGPTFHETPVAPKPPPLPPVTLVPPRSAKPPVNTPGNWVPIAKPNDWRWIVIHHSATPTGGALAFDKMHRAKGWDELGYHFVIGNGTDTRDGQIEVGSRWPKQKWGAHAKTPDNRYNEYGIGICLVGNFDLTNPTDAQMKSVEHLVSYLMRTYHISPDHVLGHGDTKPTHCPGSNMNVALVRRVSTRLVADSGESPQPDSIPEPTRTASAELLTDTPVKH